MNYTKRRESLQGTSQKKKKRAFFKGSRWKGKGSKDEHTRKTRKPKKKEFLLKGKPGFQEIKRKKKKEIKNRAGKRKEKGPRS